MRKTLRRELITLADYIRDARETLLLEWYRAVKRDPALRQGDALPSAELYDHIPALLTTFERNLRLTEQPPDAALSVKEPAAAHGLQRWQQGYDLREVTRELGQLNKCVITELDRYADTHPGISLGAMSKAREVWTDLCGATLEEGVGQYFSLQQREAAGHAKDLEEALAEVRELEEVRANQWRQAAHDMRGNLGVVANVAVGLTRHGQSDTSREGFVRILMRNVTSLHHLLEDVTSLARLQAGREKRQIESIDVATIMEPLCEGIRPLAQQRGLFLKSEGPVGLAVDGDAVKIRRIAQNLILNAVKYTRSGSILVAWGESTAGDSKRWLFTVQDTGPGIHTHSGQPLAELLESAREPLPSRQIPTTVETAGSLYGKPGEGIGLSIVKRLCEMLDAKLEMHSVLGEGTTFRILFPKQYST